MRPSSPLWGGVGGGGGWAIFGLWRQAEPPPPLIPPHKGEGDAVVHQAIRCVRPPQLPFISLDTRRSAEEFPPRIAYFVLNRWSRQPSPPPRIAEAADPGIAPPPPVSLPTWLAIYMAAAVEAKADHRNTVRKLPRSCLALLAIEGDCVDARYIYKNASALKKRTVYPKVISHSDFGDNRYEISQYQ